MLEAIGSFFGGLWALAVACLLAGAGWLAFDTNNKKALTLIRIGFVFTAIFFNSCVLLRLAGVAWWPCDA